MRRWAAVLAAAVLGLLTGCGTAPAPSAPQPEPPRGEVTPPPLTGEGTALSPLAVRLEDADAVRVRFKRPPRAGVLFDLDTGRVLWRRAPERRLPMASLTKLMTALVATERIPRHGSVKISAHALDYAGSGVGMLPRGKWVRIDVMLHGLLLASGNDAARAIAERAGGSIRGFVRLMNQRARQLGLGCTRFTSPDGLDSGNRSCAADLAALSRAVVREPRIARIAARRKAALRYPGKGGRLWLYSTNPLLRTGYRGATGLKTGYTKVAGRCLVATARRGRVRLGVVLLDSPDTGRQAAQLLDRGFRVIR